MLSVGIYRFGPPHLDYRPPYPKEMRAGDVGLGKGEDEEAGYNNVVWHPDLAGDYLFEAPSLDGRLPFMEVKVFYVLSDLSESDSGQSFGWCRAATKENRMNSG